jgi:hypothetical protein
MSDFEWNVWEPKTATEREKLGPPAIIDGKGEVITEIDPREVPRYQEMARKANAERVKARMQAQEAAERGRPAQYVLSIIPTREGYAKNPAWRDFGTSVSVYSRAELDRRLEAAEAARQAGEISDVQWRELTAAELREAEECRQLHRQRLEQQRAREIQARGLGQER